MKEKQESSLPKHSLLVTAFFIALATLILSSSNLNAVDLGQCWSGMTANSIYTLNQSVSSAGACFNITAANVTLDCQGFWVDYGSSGAGFGIESNATNSTVKNCLVNKTSNNNGHGEGIRFHHNANGTIYNNTVYSASGADDSCYGIALGAASIWNNVSNNTISTKSLNGYGIVVDVAANYNVVSENTISTNTGSTPYGIYLNTNTDNNVTKNTISTSTTYTHGIYLGYKNFRNKIWNNTISTTGTFSIGVYLKGCSADGDAGLNDVSSNTFTATSLRSYGIKFENCKSNNASNNSITTAGN